MGDDLSRREGPAVETPRPPAKDPSRPDPYALLRSRNYLILLVLAAAVGVPVAAVAYLLLAFVSKAHILCSSAFPRTWVSDPRRSGGRCSPCC